MDHPGLFGYLELKTEGIEELPEPATPYYIIAKDGFFFHKRTLIGDALMPVKQMPGHLAKTGHDKGVFWWNDEVLPATICAQAVSFFRRIYEKYKTEAEVLITKNAKTGEYRLFIPTQRVTGASVSSSYDPAHISTGWQVVGTMHSHCMMSAFHSGTDMNDASDIDGIHITVGKVMDEKPEVVAMVTMDGMAFHFKDVAEMADFSNLDAAAAPEWWDRYVNKLAPQQPKNVIHYPKGHWSAPKQPYKTYQQTRADLYADWGWSGEWGDYNSSWRLPPTKPTKDTPTVAAIFNGAIDDDLADAMLSSNLLTEEDFDENVDTDKEGFAALFLQKLADAASILALLGLDAEYKVTQRQRAPIAVSQLTAFTEDIPL